jgi:hypothetical protein
MLLGKNKSLFISNKISVKNPYQGISGHLGLPHCVWVAAVSAIMVVIIVIVISHFPVLICASWMLCPPHGDPINMSCQSGFRYLDLPLLSAEGIWLADFCPGFLICLVTLHRIPPFSFKFASPFLGAWYDMPFGNMKSLWTDQYALIRGLRSPCHFDQMEGLENPDMGWELGFLKLSNTTTYDQS